MIQAPGLYFFILFHLFFYTLFTKKNPARFHLCIVLGFIHFFNNASEVIQAPGLIPSLALDQEWAEEAGLAVG